MNERKNGDIWVTCDVPDGRHAVNTEMPLDRLTYNPYMPEPTMSDALKADDTHVWVAKAVKAMKKETKTKVKIDEGKLIRLIDSVAGKHPEMMCGRMYLWIHEEYIAKDILFKKLITYLPDYQPFVWSKEREQKHITFVDKDMQQWAVVYQHDGYQEAMREACKKVRKGA